MSTTILPSAGRFGVRTLCVALSLALAAVPGCANQQKAAALAANPALADACKPQREELHSYDDYFGKSMLIGAGIGAVAGGLIGYAIKGDAKAALAGAAVGAAAGAAGGYWQALSQQKSDRAAQTQQVLSDVNADNEKITAIQASFDKVVSCRRQQADQIRADYKAGKLTRDQADEAMKKAKSRFDDDIAFAQKIDGKISERSANFQFATEQLTPQPYIVTTANLPVYASADPQAKVVSRLKLNTPIMATSQDDTWATTALPGGATGYVLKEKITLASAMPAPAPATTASSSKTPPKNGARPPAVPATQVAANTAAKDPLSQGVYTNVTKRTEFGNSVKTAQAASNGFELGT